MNMLHQYSSAAMQTFQSERDAPGSRAIFLENLFLLILLISAALGCWQLLNDESRSENFRITNESTLSRGERDLTIGAYQPR